MHRTGDGDRTMGGPRFQRLAETQDHLVLTSDISVKEGRAYEASFTAKATTETDFELLLQ